MILRTCIIMCIPSVMLMAQEAASGFDLSATAAGVGMYSHELVKSPRDGSPVAAGFRAMLYPTWKLGKHWSVSGAVEVISTPYFQEDVSTKGYALAARVLQASIGYSQVWKKASISFRAGQLSSVFGTFLLRYDDAANPLIQMPVGYGYYGAGVSTLGLMGAQVTATAGKWDGSLQLANSSPANPRGLFEKDQYGNWAGSAGYTIYQGLRVGVSGYRGPYLDRQSPFFFSGESRPKDLPATAVGSDVEWAYGHWNIYGEWQHFDMAYHVIPTFRQTTAYVEVRRVLRPRWYVAARVGSIRNSVHVDGDAFESAVGFRASAHELIKIGCIVERETTSGKLSPTLAVQAVTSLHLLSLSRD